MATNDQNQPSPDSQNVGGITQGIIAIIRSIFGTTVGVILIAVVTFIALIIVAILRGA